MRFFPIFSRPAGKSKRAAAVTELRRKQPGKRADINLITFDRLRLHAPEVVHDLPAGGKRLVQRVDGYGATLVAGTLVFERGAHTGAKPGCLVRRGR
jgi:N-acyl-D-aspartate/D-glutamate deacylase